MVSKSHAKRRQDIKTKLMAAIAMLLVSSIMMVSSTYAWFTLSTAPEVTGISTAVGANGNLEMALLPKDGLTSSITSEAGDSTKDIEQRNVTWGNLVDLGDSSIYGLDQIKLYPSALNLTADGKVDVTGFMLQTPKYGADGRVESLTPNAVASYFDKGQSKFFPNSDKGVRALGTASGMTPRQLSYRNALSAANTASALAANKASASLNNNGSNLANIAIQYGMNGATAKFGKADVVALRAIINDLKGEGGVLDQIETAYMQYILAYAASAATDTAAGSSTAGDAVWNTVETAVKADGATLASVVSAIGADKIPAEVSTGIEKYNATVASVATADSKLQGLETGMTDGSEFTWEQIKDAMTPLANPTAMTINGINAGEVKEKLGELVSSVTAQGGLKVIMGTGAGVYADIADQSGDYTASITIEQVEYNGITLDNMAARMETASNLKPAYYLVAIGTAVNGAGAPAGTSGTAMPISEMYGYVIDLAFRTNAADSKLLLQVNPADRIYNDNPATSETMGNGSSMTFMATTTDFTNDQVKGLMNAIKIVFFDPANGTIYCYGGLDTANASVGANGITANIYLYTVAASDSTKYVAATADQITAAKAGTAGAAKLYTKGADETYTEVTDINSIVDNGEYYVAVTTTAGDKIIISGEKPEIMALTQNTAHALSVLVYLDGNVVGNDDVAATASTSMTGTMNLQFASSANLTPMDYASLHQPATPSTPANPDEGEGA